MGKDLRLLKFHFVHNGGKLSIGLGNQRDDDTRISLPSSIDITWDG